MISRKLWRNALASGRYSTQNPDGAYIERRQRATRSEQDVTLAPSVRQHLSEAWCLSKYPACCAGEMSSGLVQ